MRVVIELKESSFEYFLPDNEELVHLLSEMAIDMSEVEEEEEKEVLEETCNKLGIDYANVLERLRAAGLTEENLLTI